MGRKGYRGCKRLAPPMVVRGAAVAPPGCVSVGGAIPAHHQYHQRDLPDMGSPSSRVQAGEVLVEEEDGIASTRMCRRRRGRAVAHYGI